MVPCCITIQFNSRLSYTTADYCCSLLVAYEGLLLRLSSTRYQVPEGTCFRISVGCLSLCFSATPSIN